MLMINEVNKLIGFSSQILTFRATNNYTQKELSEKIGVSRDVIINAEKGNRNIRAVNKRKIEIYLDKNSQVVTQHISEKKKLICSACNCENFNKFDTDEELEIFAFDNGYLVFKISNIVRRFICPSCQNGFRQQLSDGVKPMVGQIEFQF